MRKNFAKWNCNKIQLEDCHRKILYKEGEIWWTHIGVNLGVESCGKGENFQRPVLILKKLGKYSCIVLPVTTQPQNGHSYIQYSQREHTVWIMLNQIKTISIKRIYRRQLTLLEKDFIHIKSGFINFLKT